MKERYYSLDVFRGATVCLMILVNNPGTWAHIYPPLKHAAWHGLTPTDLVFPFFLFAVGNALSFVMPRLREGGPAVFWKKVVTRSLIIYLVGLFLTWWPFVQWREGSLQFRQWVDPQNPESGVRVLGVLARIAISYFFAAIIIYYFKPRAAFFIGLLILLTYWLLSFTLGDAADPYSMAGWFGNHVDRALLGVAHMYKGEGMPFDPEGIMSTLPAIVQVIFGYMVGDYIQKKGKSFEMLTQLFLAAVALLVTGYCWDLVFPINKKIWTSSYVVYTTGLAILTLATLIYFIEFRGARNGITKFFDVFGKNALFIFALSAFIPKGLALLRLENGVNPWNWLYKKLYVNVMPADPRFGSLLFALTVIFFMWFIAWWMDRRRIYVRV
ncbi:MAG TPA: DUF5009 domain-containing protein [Chitinophagaceae bacterium]|nr:DUF5009 domain-containing protein [Chitinophagaceae bacterium]